MNPAEHSQKVTTEAVEKKAKNPFQCDNCGATFVSESEKRAHAKTAHPEKTDKQAE